MVRGRVLVLAFDGLHRASVAVRTCTRALGHGGGRGYARGVVDVRVSSWLGNPSHDGLVLVSSRYAPSEPRGRDVT